MSAFGCQSKYKDDSNDEDEDVGGELYLVCVSILIDVCDWEWCM